MFVRTLGKEKRKMKKMGRTPVLYTLLDSGDSSIWSDLINYLTCHNHSVPWIEYWQAFTIMVMMSIMGKFSTVEVYTVFLDKVGPGCRRGESRALTIFKANHFQQRLHDEEDFSHETNWIKTTSSLRQSLWYHIYLYIAGAGVRARRGMSIAAHVQPPEPGISKSYYPCLC